MIAFVHIAKTAGTSISTMLRSAHGVHHCDSVDLRVETPEEKMTGPVFIPKYSPDDVRAVLNIAPGLRSLGGHHVALWSDVETVVPDVTYLLFLRDPVGRGASHFQYNHQTKDMTRYFGTKHLTWDQWVKWEVHHNHQVKLLSKNVDAEDAIRLIESKRVFIGLMDRFDESLVLFRGLFRPELNIAYVRQNTATDNAIANTVLGDRRKVDQIKEMYAKEFPVYDYVVNEVYPRYVKEYGAKLAEDVNQFKSFDRRKVSRTNMLMHRLNRKLVFGPRHRKYLRVGCDDR